MRESLDTQTFWNPPELRPLGACRGHRRCTQLASRRSRSEATRAAQPEQRSSRRREKGVPAPYKVPAESRAICSLASTAGSLNRAKGLIGSPPSRQLAASTWEGATPRRRAHAVSAIAIQTRGCRLLACLPVYSSITHSASPRMTSAECDVSYEAPGAGSLRDSSVVRLPCSQEVRAVWWR